MTEVTITLDEQIVERAKRVAYERHTSLDALVRSFVEQLAAEGCRARARPRNCNDPSGS
jgi:hypothetical protein